LVELVAVVRDGETLAGRVAIRRKEKVPRENNVPLELVTPENIATYLPKSQ
ncbi:rhizopine-binding protein, partial [Rhizobium ruizarguesonis]